MKRLFSYYLRILKISFMDEMTDRLNFFTWSLVHTISLLTLVAVFEIIFSQIHELNGWSKYQVLLVLGVGTLITGLGSMTFFSFMYDNPREIRSGEFDFKLARPLDVHFQAAFASIDIDDLVVVPNGIILIIYSVSHLGTFSVFNIVPFLVLLISSMIILFSVMTLLQSLAFKHIVLDSLRDFYWSIVNVTKSPVKSFKNTSTLLTVLLVPIAVISSVPAEVLFGRFDLNWILGSIISATVLFFVSRRVYLRALQAYSSASS